jgi:ubiquinone biosynthesis protein
MSTTKPSTVWKPRLQTAVRAAEVTRILLGFGFDELVQAGGLGRFLDRGEKAEAKRRSEPIQVRVRLLLEALGPTFVKAGQILSTRPDLVPSEWVRELAKLQSKVPPAPWEDTDGEDGVRTLLDQQYGERFEQVFATFDPEAIAAGSMAQVHRAQLVQGDDVVVKVLRPGIRDLVTSDVELARGLARLTQHYFSNLGFDVEAVIDEFSRQLTRETDLGIEAASTARMRRDFEDDDEISFPRTYPALSTRDVLVMEEVHGTLLADLDLTKLDREQRTRLARHGADMVFRQCLKLGFFHADPHPGNIFVLPGEKLVFIDCGMTGMLDPGTTQLLTRFAHGVMQRDLDEVVRVAQRLGDADGRLVDDRAFRSDVWQLIDRFEASSIESLQFGALLNDFFEVLRRHDLRVPADIVYLIKALTTIEGVAETVAPEFDLMAHVRPYFVELMGRRYGLRGARQRMVDALFAYGDLVEELPRQIADFFRAVRKRQLHLQVDHSGLERFTAEVERASMNISWALVVAALVVGAAVLILADNLDGDPSTLTTMANWTFVAAMLAGVWRLLRFRMPWK